MKVQLASYQAVSILHGGPNTQIRNTMRFLPDNGVTASLFDPWTRFRKGDCDIVHLFAANIGTYHLAREIGNLGVPLVVSPIIYTRHAAAFVKRGLMLTRAVQKVGPGIWSDYGLSADICAWAARVLPNTRAEADFVIHGLGVPSPKVQVVPNGVDERFAYGDPSLFRRQYGRENFILNVGHIGHARKNVLTLIRALAQIDHPAVIIGRFIPGAYGEACRKEAARHKHILLIDGLDNESEMLASAYAACDVFVLPSLFETPGIAALEAGMAGAKVVITPHGGTREYFDSLALYVEPGSVASIRDGILQALATPKTPALSTHIRSHFLWQQVAAQTATAYRTMLEKTGR